MDGERRFIAVSPGAERLWGRPRDTLLGRTVLEVFPGAADSEFLRQLSRVLTEHVEAHFHEHYSGDGIDMHVEVDVYPTAAGGAAIFWRDVTVREREAADREFMLTFGTVLQREREPDKLLEAAQGAICEYMHASRCVLTEMEPEALEARVHSDLVRSRDESAPLTSLPRGHLLVDRPPDLVARHRAGETVVIADTMAHPSTASRYAERYAPLGVRAMISVPLIRHGVLVAGFAVTDDRPREWTPQETALVQSAADRLWLGLETARALESERRARERAERLQQVTAALGAALTPEDVAHVIVANGVAALGAQAGVIMSVSEAGTELELMTHIGYPTEHLKAWSRIPIETPIPIAEAARTRMPVVIASVAEWDARFAHPTGALRIRKDAQSWAAIPLNSGDRVLGVMGLSFTRAGAVLPEDHALMVALAQQCAQAFERTRLFAAEKMARADAEAANQAKTHFLANMSHELRTPLNAISGHVQLMEMEIHGPINTEQRETLRRVQRAQRHLLGLINDVLNFAKLGAGAVHFDVRCVALADIVAEVMPMIQPQISAKQLGFTVKLDDSGDAVLADREKLVQILVNLLSNAVKFTPARRPDGERGRVIIDVATRAATPDRLYLRVHDNGIGIPRAKQDSIFDPFVQVRADFAREHEGTGLGLSISRDLARGMGGDVRVRSVEGKGSTFTVSLIRAEPELSASTRRDGA